MQMMVNIIKNIFKVGAQHAGASTRVSTHLQNVLPILASSGNTIELGALLRPFRELLEGLWGIVVAWFYFISKFVFQVVDLIQYFVYKLAGINMSSEVTLNLPMFRLLLSDTVLDLFMSMFIIGLVLLMVFTIVAIVKSEYEIALKLEKDSKKVESATIKVMKNSLTSAILMMLVPFIIVVVIAFGSVFLSSINSALNPNGTSSTSLGGQLYVASAYRANKYRTYAENNQRVPILYDFYDPYSNNTATNYTYDELKNLYASWTGGVDAYNMVQSGEYISFRDSLVYKNNKIYNSSEFAGFEKFISTPEQYYVMADFIDYAVKNNLQFYIKNSADEEVDWNRTSSKVKITDGVYDPMTGTFNITYVDESNVNKYDNSYTLTLETNEFMASSPIADTTRTISELLAIALDDEMAETNDTKLFRMLERVDGSTNVVKWKTKSIAYNDDEFTIYNLTKRYYNTSTGLVESRATVPVAKRQSAGIYYILRLNEDGEYEYTNQTIEYNNNGKLYLDTIEPVYVYGNWPEKLYNDLKVIYEDINIDNYINYDNWADMLGEYYTTSDNVASDDVITFATTLIHPLGLIMSELFLGVTFESEGQLVTDFGFTTQYLDETIQALCFAVNGESTYWQLKCEIDSFVDMFNGLFTPIVEELQKIEGFDLYNEDEYSVQAYVYKAYLASIMLSDSSNKYFEDMAYEILNLNNLFAIISDSTVQYEYNANGDMLYDFEYEVDEDGNYVKILYTSGGYGQNLSQVSGKYVYNPSGKRVVVCDELGVASNTDKYVPSGGIYGDNVNFNMDTGRYEIKYFGEFYDYQTFNEMRARESVYDPDLIIPTWEKLFEEHFTSYYSYKLDHENYFTYNNKNYSIIANPDGYIHYTVDSAGSLNDLNEDYYSSAGIYYVPKVDADVIVSTIDGAEESDILQYKVRRGDSYVPASELTPENFLEAFEPAKARLYVYDNVDPEIPESAIGEVVAPTVVISTSETTQDDKQTIFYVDYAIKEIITVSSTEVSVSNLDTIITQIDVLAQEYYLYEKTYTPKATYNYTTYEELPSAIKSVFDNMMETLYAVDEKDRNKTFLPYLEYYLANEVVLDEEKNVKLTMGEILSVEMPSSSKVNEIEEDLSDTIEYLIKNKDKSHKRRYKNKKKTVCQYYKFKILKAIQAYMSTRISSGYNIVVNGHAFNVEQAMSSTQFMEIVFGNNVTYSSLSSALKHGALYDDLNKFDQSAMLVISSHLEKELADLKNVIKVLNLYKILNTSKDPAIFYASFRLNERQLELINNFYEMATGVNQNLITKKLAQYLRKSGLASVNGKMYNTIVDTLEIMYKDLGYILSRYMDGQSDVYSTTKYYKSNIEATTALSRYVDIISRQIELSFIHPDYTGIIDESGVWGELRSFLKSFGRLCFDLETKSNFGSLQYGETDKHELVSKTDGYVEELLDMLNNMLADVDFGSASTSITKIGSLADLKAFRVDEDGIYEEVAVGEGTTYNELTGESKYYMSIVHDYFTKVTDEYNSVIQGANDAYNMIQKFKTGRYALQPNSLMYTDYLKKYLEHFKYNTDSDKEDIYNPDTDAFIGYMYEDYYLEIDDSYSSNMDLSDADRLNYYFKYIEAFENFAFSNQGNYFSGLSPLQQKVVIDCLEYYKGIKEKTQAELTEKYSEYVDALNNLEAFIFAEADKPVTMLEANISGIITREEVNVINLYNTLNFMGLDFDVNKGLREYRIDALNALVNFSEYSGESAASIQSRYLSLLYLACSDFTENVEGSNYIGYDDNSKQIILTLAGIQDRADEQLVDLEYEIDYSSSVADEKYGSIFIICTYNEETLKYEPFVFASGGDKYNTPISSYYQSVNNNVCYYPVIAKGIFDENGKPTAIREVNGYIEFYRDDVYRFRMNEMMLDVYYMTEEDTSGDFGLINTIISTVKTTLSKFLMADSLQDSIPYLEMSPGSSTCYGSKTSYIYHLENGSCNLNYMFYQSSGIGVGYLYDITQLNIIILVIACAVLLKAMWSVAYGVVGSIFQIGILVAICPAVLGVQPIKGDVFKSWKKKFIKQFFMMYGYIVALNAYFILLILIDQMGNLITSLSPRSLEILDNTMLFNKIDVFTIVSFLLSTTILLIATTMLDKLSKNFSDNLFGAGNALAAGEKLQKQKDAVIKESEYFNSGYMLKDSVADFVDETTSTYLPFLNPSNIHKNQAEAQRVRNATEVDRYKNSLLAQGISADVADNAAEAYKKALDEQVETKLKHQEAEAERRKARRDALKAGHGNFSSGPDKKEVTCKNCGRKFPKNAAKGANKCPYCHGKWK